MTHSPKSFHIAVIPAGWYPSAMAQRFSLKDLLQEQMRDMYDAETNYHNMLPELIRTATAPDLISRLEAISVQSLQNAEYLTRICGLLGVPSTGVTCEAMKGLLREVKSTTQDWGSTATIDASLIAGAQRIVHYEIAGFGTGRAFAVCLGEKEITHLLETMLEQAVDNDKALTRIASGGWFTDGINMEALKATAA
jgi:ferritin-like metal-binding protein YciE